MGVNTWIREVEDTPSQPWLLTGIPQRAELAKRDFQSARVRDRDALAHNVDEARLESRWRCFSLCDVARAWRRLLKRRISRVSHKLPFKPSSGPARSRHRPPSNSSRALFQVAPSAFCGWPSWSRLIGLNKITKGLWRKSTTPSGANGSVASLRSLLSQGLSSTVCLVDLGRHQLHLLVYQSLVPYRHSFRAETRGSRQPRPRVARRQQAHLQGHITPWWNSPRFLP